MFKFLLQIVMWYFFCKCNKSIKKKYILDYLVYYYEKEIKYKFARTKKNH